MQLSVRLNKVADFVTEGYRVCDIGTDHGYIPIKLVKEGKVPEALAMDINKGPLERADEHIREYGLDEKIQTRLSDGMEKLIPEEADSVVIAGMGGMLVTKILENGWHVLPTIKELIISPHTEINIVREYLVSHKFKIVKEDMIFDMGKYYTVIKAVFTDDEDYVKVYGENEYNYVYGKYFIDLVKEGREHIVFCQYLHNELEKCETVLKNLENASNANEKKAEVQKKIKAIKDILQTT